MTDEARAQLFLDRFWRAVREAGEGGGVVCIYGEQPGPPFGLAAARSPLFLACASGRLRWHLARTTSARALEA